MFRPAPKKDVAKQIAANPKVELCCFDGQANWLRLSGTLVEDDRLTQYERQTLGWRVLRNESFLLDRGADSIAIAGVDNINVLRKLNYILE